jgi:hypothetical protein
MCSYYTHDKQHMVVSVLSELSPFPDKEVQHQVASSGEDHEKDPEERNVRPPEGLI